MGNKKIIKRLLPGDKQLINMLLKTKCCTFEQALTFIKPSRIEQLRFSGIVNVACGMEGRVIILRENGHLLGDISKGIYRGVSTRHDLGLAREYLNLTEEQRQGVWAGEYWCKVKGHEVNNSPDMVVEVEGEEQVQYIEVVTKNYKQEDILGKQVHANMTNSKIKIIKV